MKVLIVLVVLTVVVSGQRPSYNQEYPSGPYQPSGWRPSGPQFYLPARQQLPRVEYGPPEGQYGVPQQEYGPPITTTETIEESTTTEIPTTTELPESEQLKDVEKKSENLVDEELPVTQEGVYYVYHPSGLLQRVVFMTREDAAKMAYRAELKYENVEPIREPIYTYDPKTLAFQQLQLGNF